MPGSPLGVLASHDMRVPLDDSLHGENIGGRALAAEKLAISAINEAQRNVNFYHVVLISSAQYAASYANGENKGFETPRPNRLVQELCTKPAIDVVSEFLKFLSVI